MADKTISISMSRDEQDFIAGQIAAGNYADAQDMLHAGLAALMREAKIRALRGTIAADEPRPDRGAQGAFNEPDDLTPYVVDNAAGLRSELESSEGSGASPRQIPDIIASVKAKLRANGSL
jgi:putative addiction module CopG family antidote